MTRIDDLIGLIQTANEIYLINPSHNIRSAFIQIDDLCELAIKSWLQMDIISSQKRSLEDLENQRLVQSRNHKNHFREYCSGVLDQAGLLSALGISSGSAQETLFNSVISLHQPLTDWSPEWPNGRFKTFPDIIDEVKGRTPLPTHQDLHYTLDRIQDRRTNRNHFFHDHNQAGLTVDEQSCLHAFCDLYDLSNALFGNEFFLRVQANPVVQAQIAVIKLRLKGFQTSVVYSEYRQVLAERGTLQLHYNSFGHEFCALYEDATSFLRRIRQHFQLLVTEKQNEILRITNLSRPTNLHLRRVASLEEEIFRFQNAIDECLR